MSRLGPGNSPSGARVIHTGQTIVDLVLQIDALPEPGGDVFASGHQLTTGGGFNVMAAAARDRADVLYAGRLGTGRFSSIVDESLASEGIRSTSVARSDHDCGFSVALVDASAERTFVSRAGAESEIEPGHYDAVRPVAGDVVYVSGYTLYNAQAGHVLVDWLERACGLATVVVDPSPLVADLDDDLLRRASAVTDIWTANEREARVLAGRVGAEVDGYPPGGLASALSRQYDATFVVRIGPDGCVVATPSAPAVQIPGLAVEAVDTNGAGDAHTGVLCAGLVAGADVATSAHRANIAAALAVTRVGPATSPAAAEIDSVLADLR